MSLAEENKRASARRLQYELWLKGEGPFPEEKKATKLEIKSSYESKLVSNDKINFDDIHPVKKPGYKSSFHTHVQMTQQQEQQQQQQVQITQQQSAQSQYQLYDKDDPLIDIQKIKKMFKPALSIPWSLQKQYQRLNGNHDSAKGTISFITKTASEFLEKFVDTQFMTHRHLDHFGSGINDRRNK